VYRSGLTREVKELSPPGHSILITDIQNVILKYNGKTPIIHYLSIRTGAQLIKNIY
jgi:hypothetical protein